MNISIQHFIEIGIPELCEKLRKTLAEKQDIADVILNVQESVNKLGCDMVKSMLEGVDADLIESAYRKKHYEIIRQGDQNQLLCSMGTFTYERTYFKDKRTGKRVHLTDEQFGIRPHARLTEDAIINVVEEAVESSYRKGGKRASISDNVSKQTVKNILHDLKVEKPEKEVKEKKKVRILQINADEDHVSAQFMKAKGDLKPGEDGRKHNTIMPKIVYVYEDVIPESEAPGNKRHKLVNAHYFGGVREGKKNSELWQEVADYIESHYDHEFLEKVYLIGDGASWIKSGLGHIEKSEFVLDKFHRNKYIKKSISHLKDSQEDAWDMINDSFSLEDKGMLNQTYKQLKECAETESKREEIEAGRRYLLNNWEGITIYNRYGHEIKGCSAEGHVSHVYADRMSSRPMGWSIVGVDVMSRLRCYVNNGNKIYDLIMYRKYKEAKEQEEMLQDQMIKQARRRVTASDAWEVKLGPVETGHRGWIREILKNYRSICG